MALISDLRKGDEIQIREDLNDEQLELLYKFTCRKAKNRDVANYVKQYGFKKPFKITEICRTAKTHTEFAVIVVGGVPISIQTRYLKLSKRVSSHPVTSIFM